LQFVGKVFQSACSHMIFEYGGKDIEYGGERGD
jgi:hypothetical protein